MPSRTAWRGRSASAGVSGGLDAPRAASRPSDGPAPCAVGAVVLGVDPGTRVVGYGALRLERGGPRPLVAGAIRTARAASVPERLAEIRRELEEVLARWKPAIVVVEEAFAARNVQSALRIGEGRGVVLAAGAACGAQVFQYPPAVVKKVLVGHGGAHKSQVAAMVVQELGLEHPPEPLDATDALALALTHVLRAGLPGGGRIAGPGA